MKNSNELINPNHQIPDHFEMVYVTLKDEPEKRYYGCYIGVGAWSCLGRGTVMTWDILGWEELPLGVDPFQDEIPENA